VTVERRAWFLVGWTCGLVATGVGVLLGAVVVRLTMGADASGWWPVVVIGVVALPFTFVAGLLSEPLVSGLQTWIERRVSAESTSERR
jgi:hypothetical protein